MTWEELSEKYKKYWVDYYFSDPVAIIIDEEPLFLRFNKNGAIEASYVEFERVSNRITIATDRTPEQMDAIITALTEKE